MATQKRTVEVALSTTGVDAQGRPQRVPLVVADDGSPVAVEAPPMVEPDLAGEHMLINIGPQHPATHGVLRLVLELDGETVVLKSPAVGKPIAVRYAWGNNPEVSLYNKVNLPAAPFRTDDWPGVTAGKN